LPVGTSFDSILDRYGDGIIILGMAYYSYIHEPNIWVVIISVIALIGSPMSMMVKDTFFRAFRERYDADKMDGPAKFLLAGRDGRLFLIFAAGVSGQVFAIIVMLAFTTNLLALYRTIKVGLKIGSSRNVSKGNTNNRDHMSVEEKDLLK
jgi:CDP-L-myo-inositol myo-inositolphosphotransferase